MGTVMRGPLPIKVDATSNGEFRPVPLTEHVARANREANGGLANMPSASAWDDGHFYNLFAVRRPPCSR